MECSFFQTWRRSYDIPPPPLEKSDERWSGRSKQYAVSFKLSFNFITFLNSSVVLETEFVTFGNML